MRFPGGGGDVVWQGVQGVPGDLFDLADLGGGACSPGGDAVDEDVVAREADVVEWADQGGPAGEADAGLLHQLTGQGLPRLSRRARHRRRACTSRPCRCA